MPPRPVSPGGGYDALVTSNGPLALRAVPLLAFGGYYLAGRFPIRARRRRGTRYVLTDQRALSITNGEVRAYPSAEGPIRTTIRGGGSHVTVVYGPPPEATDPGRVLDSALSGGAGADGVTFEDVPDVAGLLDATRRAATRGHPPPGGR